jgi:hypothetical protein
LKAAMNAAPKLVFNTTSSLNLLNSCTARLKGVP